MINPNKYIRQSIIQAVSPIPCWDNMVPKNVTTTPNSYCLITSMGKQEFARAKNCYEWLVSLNIEVIHVGSLGYSYSAVLDDMIANIIPKMKSLTNNTIRIKNVNLEFENDLSFNSTTNTINRKILSYEVWCDYQEEVTT